MFTLPVYLLVILVTTDAFEDDFTCDRFWPVRMLFKDCLEIRGIYDIEDIIERAENDRIFTSDEILSKLTEICSNSAITEGIAFCMKRLNTECPGFQDIAHDAVQNKLSFFCENNHPSSTIRDVLQNGFKYNDECADEDDVRAVFSGCAQDAFSEIGDINVHELPVSEALPLYKQLFRTWFQCCVEETRDELLTELSCGSTWKDILILTWIATSGQGYLFPTIPSSEVEKLKNA